MGKKKQAKKITKWSRKDDGISFDDIVHAGIGTLGRAAAKGKRKKFRKAVERGQRLVEAGIEPLDQILAPELEQPVISYEHSGGGWFSIDVEGTAVDRVQGEEAAAARAGELLAAYAGLETSEQDQSRYGVFDAGGGWFDVIVHGVPVTRVQGREQADEALAELESL